MHMNDLLAWVLDAGASDLHLKVGQPPALRLHGRIVRADAPALSASEMKALLDSITPPHAVQRLEAAREADVAYVLADAAGACRSRFRCNLFFQMGQLGAVLRVIPQQIPSLASLAVPPVVPTLVEREHGLVLVTGPTGSGKSTLLAALIDHINETSDKHILTIEDPVEFVHRDKRSLLNQREIGTDTAHFAEALRRALRQDPDVILVGEMRDTETIRIAMTAAETGHLLLSTLHTNDAKQTVDRIVSTFGPDEQPAVRAELAATLWAVISQRLLRRRDGKGRVAVQEILLNTPTVRKLIEEGKTAQIDKALEEGRDFYGMQSANHHLLELWQHGVVTEEDCLAASTTPGDLRMRMQTHRFAQSAASPPGAPAPPSGAGGGLDARFG